MWLIGFLYHFRQDVTGAQVLLIVSVQFWFEEMFLDMQALPRNRGHMLTPKIGTDYVFWTIWADRSDLSPKPVRPVKKSLSNRQLDCTIA